MKNTIAIMILSLSLSVNSFAGTNLAELNIKIQKTITFKKNENANTYEKLNEVSLAEITILHNNKLETDSKKNVNNEKVTYAISKDLLSINDQKAGVNTEVPVIVEKSIFGKIKSFKITSENYENAYFDSIKRSGLFTLGEMDVRRNQRQPMVIGDQNCVTERSSILVECKQDIEINVEQSKTILLMALLMLDFEI